MLRSGVVVALATGALLGTGVPALAETTLTVSPGSVTIRAGSDVTVTATVTTADPDTEVTLSFTGLPLGVSCTAGCGTITVTPGVGKTQLLTLRAAADAPAANNVKATLRAEAAGGPDTSDFTITVQQVPQFVVEVSGQVYDVTTGSGIPAATVAMQDGAGGQFSATADSQGRFRFTSTASKPIVPGTILVGATKDGYGTGTREVEGRAGATVANVRIGLKAAVKSPTAEPPSPTEQAILPSTEASAEASEEAAADAPTFGSEEGGSSGLFSMVLIGMGVLLVALGIGAIVLLLLRRRDEDEDEEGDDAPVPQRSGPRPPTPRPAAAGLYRTGPDPTMIPRTAPLSDRTMITRPAVADAAPTMHRPLDEYGEPHRVGSGYGTGYGSPAEYSSPQPPSYGGTGYAQSAPLPPPRPPASPYSAGGYAAGPGSPAAPSYGPSPGQYGGYEPEEPRYGGGYDANAYAPNRYEQGPYDAGYGHSSSGGEYGYSSSGYEQSGYRSASGYGSHGYDSPYDQHVPDPRSGYDSSGYDAYYDRGGRQSSRSERRSLDWLDD